MFEENLRVILKGTPSGLLFGVPNNPHIPWHTQIMKRQLLAWKLVLYTFVYGKIRAAHLFPDPWPVQPIQGLIKGPKQFDAGVWCGFSRMLQVTSHRAVT